MNGNQQGSVCQLCGEPEHIRSKYDYYRHVLSELILYIPAGSFISKIVTLGTFRRYDHMYYQFASVELEVWKFNGMLGLAVSSVE